ncbi:MAG: GNAT family N-acetyltransferase, partial [Chloroflexota bacterium]|nr:GNAT family N-acetyltransferase [Chloroflexota bacterium]
LRGAGYRFIDAPLAMSRQLEGLGRPVEDVSVEVTRGGDPAVMAEIADRAFEYGTTFRRAYSRLPGDRAHIHLASVDGKPVSCVATSDTTGNCSIDMVATLPEARGRGLSSALLAHALADAAARGCRSTTLLSSKMGRGLYERLGYVPFGFFEQWEPRSAAVDLRTGVTRRRYSPRVD